MKPPPRASAARGRANYEDLARGISRDTSFLEAFFRNVLLGEKNELKNRYLHIRAQELGLVAPSGVTKPDVTSHVGINVGIKISPQEQRAKELLVADPTLSAPKLGARLGVTGRQAERIVSSLKTKMGLRRIGSRKTGHWEFPPRHIDYGHEHPRPVPWPESIDT